ncbi:MAG TPA: RNA polymerase sigma factor [Gemmatimonadaceae bacterium]|nr:RNA polymerase sigma factor [Gemmatimonadaceae bacterium]
MSQDAAAFEDLYRDNAGRIYALCLRMCGDATQAEDLTQDVFIRAWKSLGSFRGDSQLSTWLHRMAVNVCLNWLERGGKRNRRDMQLDDVSVLEERRSAAPESRMDLERAIATLPPRARQVFVLHDVEGYRHEDIARMSGVAVGTVKAQLHRARKLLQQRL